MLIEPGTPILATAADAGSLRRVASALRAGLLVSPPSAFALASIGCADAVLLAELQKLSAQGLGADHLALIVDLTAGVVEQRVLADRAGELVWTGPENNLSHSRDTAVVLDELFAGARTSVLLSTFVVQQPKEVLAPLIRRMRDTPELDVSLFMHVGRSDRDTRTDASLLADYSRELIDAWQDCRRPKVYYDPRGLSFDRDTRASWHAKCLIVDDSVSFVTSANFTEWAQQRNVEAGVLIRSREFSVQLRSHFDALVMLKQVQRLPGF